ncbi:lipase family protein [Polynucleobacter meluiroseus]|nr:lipase family protein [Polynucleobacter meluiroseus]
MKNSFAHLLFGLTLGLATSVVYADPPVAAFYESVGKMTPSGKLGQVLKQEKITTSVKGAQAWRIAYISSDMAERKTLSTALVVAPLGTKPAAGRPILVWAHGTTGTAQNCGPSQILNPVVPLNEYFLLGGNSWTDYGLPSVEEFINEGYVLIATDYQGLGGGGVHQYGVAGTQSKDLINAVRAASSLKDTGAGKKAIAYGWSQGGGAVLAAASQPDYLAQKGTAADGIEFAGFIALAPYDEGILLPRGEMDQVRSQKVMAGMTQSFTSDILGFAHFSMALYGTQAAFPQLRLSDLFSDEGAKAVKEIYTNKCVHAAADTLVFNYGKEFTKLLKAQPDNTLPWIQAIIKGSIPPVKPVAPVVIYWGTKDTTEPPIQGKLYQEQMCQLGGNVDRQQLPGEQTHFTTPGSAAPFYQAWIKDRLAGKPASNNCEQAAQLPS